MEIVTKSKNNNVDYLYRVLVILLAFFFALSGYWEISKNELTYPKTLSMGYPPYFILWLGIAKCCGAILLLVPNLKRLKEWVFAGFTFDVIFAFISGFYTNSKADYLKALVALCFILFTYSLTYKKTMINIKKCELK